jgi:hypothetical protein
MTLLCAIQQKNTQKNAVLSIFFCKFASDFWILIKSLKAMKNLGYFGAFLGGAIAGAAIGILVAPDKGSNTRQKISDTVNDFLKKHNIKLNRKDVGDLIEDLEEAAD